MALFVFGISGALWELGVCSPNYAAVPWCLMYCLSDQMFKTVQGSVRVVRAGRRFSLAGSMYLCGFRGYIPSQLAHALKCSESPYPAVGLPGWFALQLRHFRCGEASGSLSIY